MSYSEWRTHNPTGSRRVVVTKQLPGARWLQILTQADCEVAVCASTEILSAEESNGLETWLTTHGYRLPKGASKILASYIAQGMYFFVAKVNADKVKFDDKGNAMLSPLRFHYDTEEFSLPIRLGRETAAFIEANRDKPFFAFQKH